METLTEIKKIQRKPRKKKEVEVQVAPALAIIDKKKRGVLNEGKSYQMGFAFLKKISDNVFETVQPISPCKDYLNDVVYSEQTGKDCHAYGLNYNKKDIFDGNKAYMCFKICPNFGGSSYAGQAEDEKNLDENYQNIEKFLNFFEAKIGTEFVSKIEKVDNNLYMVTLPIFWCKYTYLISLFSLIIRCGQCYKDGDPLTYFQTFTKWGEMYNIKSVSPKLDKVLAGKLPVQNWDKFYGGTDVHNHGIVAQQF